MFFFREAWIDNLAKKPTARGMDVGHFLSPLKEQAWTTNATRE